MKALIATMLWLLTLVIPARAQSPTDVDYVKAASSLIDAGEYQKAIQYLNEAIRINPYGNYSYLYLGMAYEKLQLYQNAIINLTHSIQLAPLELYPYCFRGKSYFYLQEYQKAKLDYLKCRELALKYTDDKAYQFSQEAIKNVEEAINLTKPNPQPVVTQPQKKGPVVNSKTRNQLVNRACSLSKNGLTDGEILNEVYRLVQMNLNPEYQMVYQGVSTGSISSQLSQIVNRFTNGMNVIAIEEEARNIFDDAKKKCKF
jgi:tetratricopeptide (TPR) repeat protein